MNTKRTARKAASPEALAAALAEVNRAAAAHAELLRSMGYNGRTKLHLTAEQDAQLTAAYEARTAAELAYSRACGGRP